MPVRIDDRSGVHMTLWLPEVTFQPGVARVTGGRSEFPDTSPRVAYAVVPAGQPP